MINRMNSYVYRLLSISIICSVFSLATLSIEVSAKPVKDKISSEAKKIKEEVSKSAAKLKKDSKESKELNNNENASKNLLNDDKKIEESNKRFEEAKKVENTEIGKKNDALVEIRDNPFAPHIFSFKKKSVFRFKIGTSIFYTRSDPFGFSRGNAALFSRGDFGFGESGLSLHFNIDARFAQGLFSPSNDKPVLDNADPYYEKTALYYSGQQMDYLDISHLYLRYNWDFIGVDFGRIPVSEAAWTNLDGLQLRFLFDQFSFGLFGGLKSNPYSAQIVGAASGGRIGFKNILGFNEGQSPIWGEETADPIHQCKNQTQGGYANEIGTGLLNLCIPWGNLASLRFQTFGSWFKVNLDILNMDTAVVVDTFMDDQVAAFSLDRIWIYNKGASRWAEDLNFSWRGTLDVIGAKPLWLRDLAVNLDWRNIGPLSLTFNYTKINTHATAWSYAQFFRPLERPQDYTGNKTVGNQLLFDSIALNNNQLFVVNRDRLSAKANLEILDRTEIYTSLRFERRADFIVKAGNMDFSKSIQNSGDELASLGTQLSRCFAYKTGQPDTSAVQKGEISAVNSDYDAYLDPCKIGASIGLRDPFMFGFGYYDLNLKHMRGYFSSTTRAAFSLGFNPFEVLSFDFSLAYEMNQQDRVYSVDSVCDSYDSTTGTFVDCQKGQPKTQEEAGLTQYSFIAMPVQTFQFSSSANLNVFGPWYADIAYDAYIEELPFQGDYGNALGAPLARETWQLTHQIFLRTYLKF